MQRDQPDAHEPRDGLQFVQQVSEARPALTAAQLRFSGCGRREVLAVAVDGLPQQGDHPHALLDEAAGLAHQMRDRIADHAPAHPRHDAIRAVEIAAAHHGQIGVQSAVPRLVAAIDRHRIVHLEREHARGGPRKSLLAAVQHLLDQRRKPRELTRARDDVHMARAIEDFVADALRHAAHHPDDQIGAGLLGAFELPHPGPGAVLGVLAHRAGVEQHDVGLVELGGDGEALAPEAAFGQQRVVLVHLAAEGHHVHLARDLRARFLGGSVGRRETADAHGVLEHAIVPDVPAAGHLPTTAAPSG